ncbi:CoA-transferase family III [Macrolepiota fuliginosa MF-IS2]|uniref:CoA-transferase family III n=1 Tax=Macrolepiota fuliginosa MF-IS2 TaxID=1400762 RepID=A0A9P6BZH9_9AGAR|nr:CoA-transferase family III [Macrolepiota fuliginosa MF-IS2]
MALTGIKVVEFAGLAPGPFAGLVLADNGASVTRIDRPNAPSADVLTRGKRSIAVNSKIPSGRDLLRKLIASADVVIDPFRPGVMEKLGLGPEVFFGDGKTEGLNEKLIYARIAGFPRTGPLKDMAGHDLNYIALTGALAMMPPGPSGVPTFPMNILADFAGGGATCALGILLALIERGRSGRGQVVNTDMVSGARFMSTFPLLHSILPTSSILGRGKPGTNTLDGGAPFYNVYTCKDGGWITVGCLEPQFFKAFTDGFRAALPQNFDFENGWRPTASTQADISQWPKMKAYFEKGFLTSTRDHWAKVFHGTDACVVPVLTPKEAAVVHGSSIPEFHPPVAAQDLLAQPSREPINPGELILQPGLHTEEVLREAGLSDKEIRKLTLDGALGEEAHKSARVNVKL